MTQARFISGKDSKGRATLVDTSNGREVAEYGHNLYFSDNNGVTWHRACWLGRGSAERKIAEYRKHFPGFREEGISWRTELYVQYL